VRPIVISGLVALAAGIGVCAAVLPAAKATSAAPAAASRPATTISVPGALRAEHAIAGLRPSASPDFAAAPAATLAANNELLDVSCVGTNNCLAVGGNFAGGTAHGAPLAYHWDGAWHATPVKLPAGGTLGVLGSVSCKSDGCVAVGWYRNGSVNRPLAEMWSTAGKNWVVMRQPPMASGGSADFLEWVSCATSVKNCVATGFYVPTSNSNAEVALAEVWNGSSWTAFKPPTPSTPFSNLDAVSCNSIKYCLAVGGYLASNGGLLLADLWNGSAWHQMAITQVTPQSGWFNFANGVSCTATSCVAVGNTGQLQSNGTVKIAAFAEVHGASGWTKTSVPMPAGQQSLLLTPACVTSKFCVAVGGVGSYTSTNNQGHAAVATWNGSAWTVKVLTPPSGQGSLLMGADCLSTTNCVASGTVGKFGTQTGHGLTAFFNGTTWTTKNTA
jgi:hypothetical protein